MLLALGWSPGLAAAAAVFGLGRSWWLTRSLSLRFICFAIRAPKLWLQAAAPTTKLLNPLAFEVEVQMTVTPESASQLPRVSMRPLASGAFDLRGTLVQCRGTFTPHCYLNCVSLSEHEDGILVSSF